MKSWGNNCMKMKKIFLYVIIVLSLFFVGCVDVKFDEHAGKKKLSYTMSDGTVEDFYIERGEQIPSDALLPAEGKKKGAYNLGWRKLDGGLIDLDQHFMDTDLELKEYFIPVVVPANVTELRNAVAEALKNKILAGDLNYIDTSKLTDMSGLFNARPRPIGVTTESEKGNLNYMDLDIDISKWDVSKVTNFNYMFAGSGFAGDISAWNVSSATSMKGMFYGASLFDVDLSSWDVSKVTDMESMFQGARAYSNDLSSWASKLAPTVKHNRFAQGTEEDTWSLTKLPFAEWGQDR